MPDRRQKRLVFSTIAAKMNLSDEVDTEDFVARPDKISGADINSICQEVSDLFARLSATLRIFRLACMRCARTATWC